MNRKDQFNGHLIDLMMSVDKQPESARKHVILQSLANSLTEPPRKKTVRSRIRSLFTRRKEES